MSIKLEKSFRLLDFNIYDEIENKDTSSDSEEGSYSKNIDKKKFIMQIFGIGKNGDTFCLIVNDFNPFFYIKLPEKWDEGQTMEFIGFLKEKMGKYFENSLLKTKIVNKKKLYGFDGGKKTPFLLCVFKNTTALNKVKYLFYENTKQGKRLSDGLKYNDSKLYLYESNIPPLLRYFHIRKSLILYKVSWISC